MPDYKLAEVRLVYRSIPREDEQPMDVAIEYSPEDGIKAPAAVWPRMMRQMLSIIDNERGK